MIHRKWMLSLLAFSIVLSLAMLSCSSVANLPNPFATATPTATATFTPTVTPSPTPTLTPTATPKPTGMVIRDVPGGSSRFFDYDGGYSIDIPGEWIPVQLDAQDVERAISNLKDSYPGIADALKAGRQADYGGFRIIAYDKQPEHYNSDFAANFTVSIYKDRLASSMPLDLVLKATIDQMRKQMPGIQIKQLESTKNVQGMPVGASEATLQLSLPDGSKVPVYEKQLYFQTPNAIVVITFAAAKKDAPSIVPSFDKLINGIQILEP